MPIPRWIRWSSPLGQSIAGTLGLLLLAFVSFESELNLGTTAFVFLLLLAALTLLDDWRILTTLGVVAVTVLTFFFAPPIFNFEVEDPRDLFALVAFVAVLALVAWLRGKRRHAEEARHRIQSDLERMNRVMMLGEVTASIAHEVNQPIAATVTNANACARFLAADPPNLEQAQAALSRILRDSRRAVDVVGRVRSLTRNTPPPQGPVDLNRAIIEVAELIRGEMAPDGIRLRTDLAPDLPNPLGDRVQLQQVLLNLLINAIEATRGVGRERREISVASRCNTEGEIVVEVRDRGVGLGSVDTERLFDSFYTTKAGGIGVGLAICRSIVESHGGRIWAAPNRPDGAVLGFSIAADRA